MTLFQQTKALGLFAMLICREKYPYSGEEGMIFSHG